MIVEGNPRLFAKLKGENLEELRKPDSRSK
jgi:hypothetical protein